jgi:transcriptional regulator with XRE-family HTH domain
MRLKEYRERQHMTREQLSGLLGVSMVTIWRWETGQAYPRASELKKISDWSKGKVTPNDMMLDL